MYFQIYPKIQIKCHQCSSKTDPQCLNSQMEPDFCPTFDVNNKCATIVKDGELIRKCTAKSKTVECANSTSCSVCATSGCNGAKVENVVVRNCLQCNSNTNRNCSNKPLAIRATPCNNPLESACYSRLNGNAVERGCYSDLSVTIQQSCQNNRNCDLCKTESCNRNVSF